MGNRVRLVRAIAFDIGAISCRWTWLGPQSERPTCRQRSHGQWRCGEVSSCREL